MALNLKIHVPVNTLRLHTLLKKRVSLKKCNNKKFLELVQFPEKNFFSKKFLNFL